jgi:tetratricopeptide (TPR) repeat protein
MGLYGEDDNSEQAAGKVRRWLESSGGKRCLIVFDNADNLDNIIRWLPATGNTQIVITSNRHSFGNIGTLINVEPFTIDESQAYLSERTGLNDHAGASALYHELGGMPLALAQAAAIISAQRLSYSAFLDRLHRVPIDRYLSRLPGDAYPRGAAETVLLAVEQAEHHSRLCRTLLLMLSVLSPNGTSRELLYSAPIGGGVIPWLSGLGREVSQVKIDEALERLMDVSLITMTFDGRTVIMHRFTQRVIRERAYERGIYAMTLNRVSSLIAEQRNLGEEAAWNERGAAENLIQQISSVWGNVAIRSMVDVDAICQRSDLLGLRLGRRFVRGLIAHRIWSVSELERTLNPHRAIELGICVMQDCERLLGLDDPYTLASRSFLAVAYHDTKQLDEAIELYERTLADRKRILGSDHLETLTSRSFLALAYGDVEQFDEAIELEERTLVDRRRILGPNHPDTFTSSSNLARFYQDIGRPAKAIELFQQTLADRERILGPDHKDTLRVRSYLATLLQNTGRLDIDEAIKSEQKTFASRERTLGPDHPDTLASRTNLAVVYHKAGRYDEAIDSAEQALAGLVRILDPDDLTTLGSRSILAGFYRSAGRLDEAIELYEQNLADRERILGPDHPDTLASGHYLSEALRQRSKNGRRGSVQRSRRRC